MSMVLFSSCLPHQPHPKTAIKAVVFDFGGVIAQADRELISREVGAAFHIPQDTVPSIMAKLKQHFRNGGKEQLFWESEAKSLGREVPKNWHDDFRDIYARSIRPIPGMLEIIKSLRKQGFQVALMTNVRKDKAEVLKKLGYYQYFNPIILSLPAKSRSLSAPGRVRGKRTARLQT